MSVPPQTDTAHNGSTAAPLPYGPQGRSPWLDVDWREHQRWVTVDGRPVNVIEGNYKLATGVCPWWDSMKQGRKAG